MHNRRLELHQYLFGPVAMVAGAGITLTGETFAHSVGLLSTFTTSQILPTGLIGAMGSTLFLARQILRPNREISVVKSGVVEGLVAGLAYDGLSRLFSAGALGNPISLQDAVVNLGLWTGFGLIFESTAKVAEKIPPRR